MYKDEWVAYFLNHIKQRKKKLFLKINYIKLSGHKLDFRLLVLESL